MAARKPLDYYLSLDYSFQALADPEGGFVVVFPDLPGCMTQAETLPELAEMAAEAKALWIEAEYDRTGEIPLPSYPEEYSGKFNLRLPRSLHRRLAEAAARDEVSLNQLVVGLLSEGLACNAARAELEQLATEQAAMRAELRKVATCVEEVRAVLAGNPV